ncbi:MAG: hypothetical protein ACK4VO_11135 [Pseudobdellovibrio sp.]
MIKHTIFAIAIGMLIFFLYLMQYTGAFKPITIGLDKRGPYTLIYKEHTGAYHKIVSEIEAVEKWARENKLKCRLSFGEYFDNPKAVEEGRLRSRGGCLIDPNNADESKIFDELKTKLPDGFKSDTFNETQAIVALFSGSPGIGPLKVYPKADSFSQENKIKRKGSVFEIYEIFDQTSMQTIYIWPILE